MKFKYIGPFDAVEIPGVGRVEHGEAVEFDPERSEGLKGQSDAWEHVPDPKRQRAAKKAAATKAESDNNEGEES